MKKTDGKKLLSLLMVFAMLISLFPAALAEDMDVSAEEAVFADSVIGEELEENALFPEEEEEEVLFSEDFVEELPEEIPESVGEPEDALQSVEEPEAGTEPETEEDLTTEGENPEETLPETQEPDSAEPAEEPVEGETDGAEDAETGEVPAEGEETDDPAAETGETTEETAEGEEPSEEEAEETSDEEEEPSALVTVVFTSEQEIALAVYAADGTEVSPASAIEANGIEDAPEAAEMAVDAAEAAADMADVAADVADVALAAAEVVEAPSFSETYLLAPGIYTYTASAEGYRTAENVPFVVEETAESLTVSVILDEALPYGFKGMPAGYELSEKELARKQELNENEVLNTLRQGAQYVEGELLFAAESQEQAELIAEAYNATLEDYNGSFGKMLLEDAAVEEAVEVGLDMDLAMPAVEPNWIPSIEPDIPMPYEPDVTAQALAPRYWQDWYRRAGNPDTLLRDPSSYDYQWQHDTLHSYTAWSVTTGSSAVKVAVLDSGVYASHSDLSGKVTQGPDYIGDGKNSLQDPNGHGTHVAGIIAARMNNGVAGAGIAPNVSIYSVRIANAAGEIAGGTWDLYNAIMSAVNAGCSIINLSIQGSGYSSITQSAINNAFSRGVTVIAAMGNQGSNLKMYPAAYDHVIAVGATNRDGSRAAFSNYGAWCDIAAPGVNIFSSLNTGTSAYGGMNGTSQATPVVSGAAALYMSVMGNPGPAAMEKILKKAVTGKAGAGMGAGIIDAAKLFSKVKNPPKINAFTAGGILVQDGRVATDGYLVLESGEGVTNPDSRFLYAVNGETPVLMDGAVMEGTEVSGEASYDSERQCFILPLSGFEAGQPLLLRVMETDALGVPSEITEMELALTVPEKKDDETAPRQVASVKLAGEVPELYAGEVWTAPLEIRDTEGKELKLGDVDFTWSTSNAAVAEAIPEYNAETETWELKVYTQGEGTAEITGVAQDGSSQSVSIGTVVKASVSSISISGQAVVVPGTTVSMKATVYPSNAQNKKLRWSISGSTSGISINPDTGKIKVETWASRGSSFTVRAQTVSGSSVSATKTIRVDGKATSVAVAVNDTTVKSGSKVQILCVDLPGTSDTTENVVKLDGWRVGNDVGSKWTGMEWTSSNSAVAAITSDDGAGTIRVTGLKAGKATLTAKAPDGSGKSAKITVVVSVPASAITVVPTKQSYDAFTTVTSDGLSKGFVRLAYGKSAKNKAVLGEAYGKPTVKKVAWGFEIYSRTSSSQSYSYNYSYTYTAYSYKLVTISSSGVLKLNSKAQNYFSGDWVIYAYAQTTDGTDLVDYTIYKPVSLIKAITLTYVSNGVYRIRGVKTNNYYLSEADDFSVKSSNPNIAGGFIKWDSGNPYLVVTASSASKKGIVTLTVTAMDGSNKSAKVRIRVY